MNTMPQFDFKNLLGYLSLDIISSLSLSFPRAVRSSEKIQSANKYPSIFSCQIEAVYLVIAFFLFLCMKVMILKVMTYLDLLNQFEYFPSSSHR